MGSPSPRHAQGIPTRNPRRDVDRCRCFREAQLKRRAETSYKANPLPPWRLSSCSAAGDNSWLVPEPNKVDPHDKFDSRLGDRARASHDPSRLAPPPSPFASISPMRQPRKILIRSRDVWLQEQDASHRVPITGIYNLQPLEIPILFMVTITPCTIMTLLEVKKNSFEAPRGTTLEEPYGTAASLSDRGGAGFREPPERHRLTRARS